MNFKNQTFIIAEIGQAHEGSEGIAHSFIDSLADTGVDAIKFQTHIAKAESSIYEEFRINFSYEDESRYNYWNRMEFRPEQWERLKSHCDELNIEFMSSPFSNIAVDLLESIGVKRYKVGSGEVNNFLLLEKIAKTGKDIILSSGMSSLSEIYKTLDFLKDYKNHIALLQCTTAYPTLAGEWGLSEIIKLKDKLKIPIGFSDHSGSIYPLISAFTLGAQILEFHVTFDRRMFGPDSKASLTINEVKQLVGAIRSLEYEKRNYNRIQILKGMNKSKKIFGKSITINRNMKKGEILTFNDLEGTKPSGIGIDAKDFKKIIGKKLKKDLDESSFLQQEDLI